MITATGTLESAYRFPLKPAAQLPAPAPDLHQPVPSRSQPRSSCSRRQATLRDPYLLVVRAMITDLRTTNSPPQSFRDQGNPMTTAIKRVIIRLIVPDQETELDHGDGPWPRVERRPRIRRPTPR